MKKIEISAIRIDGGTQARLKLDQDVVKEYAECMKDGDKFPPVTVFYDGSEYWLANGFHRYFATKSNGELEIECEVKQGTLDDAVLYAFSADGRQGLSRSAEDNRNIIIRMIQHPVWGKWSNAEIANSLSQENTILKDQIAIGQWDATDIEKIDIQETVTELRKQIHVLEIENRTLRDSRDMYQNRNAELMGTIKSLQSKLKKLNP
jgi:FtsZ-binding cell division protein ZapB